MGLKEDIVETGNLLDYLSDYEARAALRRVLDAAEKHAVDEEYKATFKLIEKAEMWDAFYWYSNVKLETCDDVVRAARNEWKMNEVLAAYRAAQEGKK